MELRESFAYKKNGTCIVTLNSNGICVKDDRGYTKDYLKAKDIVGCSWVKSKHENNPHTYLIVKEYRIKESTCSKTQRKRRYVKFEALYDSYSQNEAVVQRWRVAIRHLVQQTINVSCNNLDGDPPLWKKLLVLINPNSGPGRAHHIFENEVKPVLEEAEVVYEAFITERANHAMDLLQKEDLSQWRGIVIVSGDGLIYEVLNGIFKRPDWEKHISIPIGVIPGGSGNGLARAIAHTLQEPYLENPVLVSTLNVVHARLMPMDLVLIETSLGQKILSFLSISYGFLADIDKESERLRFIGEMRFTVWALVRLAKLRRYRARISYRVADGTGPISPAISANEMYSKQSENTEENHYIKRPNQCPPVNEAVPDDWIIVEDEFIMINATYQSFISSDCFISPKAQLNDGVIWLLMIRSTMGKASLLQFLLKMSNGSHVDVPGVEVIPVTALRLEPLSEGIMMVDGEEVPCCTLQGEVLPQVANVMTQ